MEWISNINKAFQYIEMTLSDSELSGKQVAFQLHMSEDHFNRSFFILTGFTLAEYIRNRRLSLAGYLLKTTDISVLEVSLKVGYESPEAFSKAFKRFHGVNPSDSKIAELKEFYPMQVKVSLTQNKPLEYAIEYKQAFYLCGTTEEVCIEDPNATNYLWFQSEANGYLDACHAFLGFENMVGVSTIKGYTIKAKCSQSGNPNTISIPGCRWVVFECVEEGAQGIIKTWDQIYTYWMPQMPYDLADLPQLEVYTQTENGYTCEIWIALQ